MMARRHQRAPTKRDRRACAARWPPRWKMAPASTYIAPGWRWGNFVKTVHNGKSNTGHRADPLRAYELCGSVSARPQAAWEMARCL